MPLIELDGANARQADLLSMVKKENGMIPNMYKAMANNPAMLDSYMHGYRLFRKESGFSSAQAEMVLLTISVENNCAYCVGAHSVLADTALKVPVEVTEAIRTKSKIPHEKFSALSVFTSSRVHKKGLPSELDVQLFLKSDYTESHILGVILAISLKTISNYTNHVFRTELDTVFKPREWKSFEVK